MVALVSRFAPPPSLVLSGPPLPITAFFQTTTGIWLVIFDKPMQEGTSNPNNYEIRVDGTRRVISGVPTVGPDRVSGDSVPAFPDAGEERIWYKALIPDLIGLNGLPVAPFMIKPDLIL